MAELFNFDIIKTRATSLLNQLFNSSMTSEATYKKFESSTYDASTGKNVSTYSEYSIDTIRSNTALEAQGASTVLSAIGFDAGEMRFVLRAADFPRTDFYDPDILKDYILIDGRDYQIKRCIPIFDIFVLLGV